MKNIYILLLFLPLIGLSQPFGNEWIDHSQQYYTFKIVQEGLYRIDQAALVAAGVPTGSFSSSEIQLFGREKELPIHISDGGDDTFDPGDYILFYAQANDGWIDSAIVPDPSKLLLTNKALSA